VGGARLAAVDAGLGVDLITFEDAEVNFSATLGGNAVIAPLSPVETERGSTPSADTPKPGKAQIYTVQSGDTIAGIAAQFDVSTNTILWANGLSAQTTLKVGDHLTILPTTGVLHTVKSGDTLLAIANQYDVRRRVVFVAQAMGGILFKVNNCLSFDIGYRWFYGENSNQIIM